MIMKQSDDSDDASASAALTRRRALGFGTAAATGGLLGIPPVWDSHPQSAKTQGIEVLRTPDGLFKDLADYPFMPHYVHVDAGDRTGTRLRMHYVDERPTDAAKASGETILL